MTKVAEHRRNRNSESLIAEKPVEVTFSLDRPGAQEVFLCGDFNEWSPTSLRMVRHDASDRWEKRLTLTPGRYQYKFAVDGEWVHDPGAAENVHNRYGSLNSVREVC